MNETDPIITRITDPLSRETRANRSLLLGFSLIGILFVQVGLVPTKLSFFGTEFSNWDERSLIQVNVLICAFYLASFVVSSISDYFILRMKILAADTEDDAYYEQLLQREADGELTEQDQILLYRHNTHGWIFKASGPVGIARLTIELILPTLFGLISLTLMAIYICKT